MATATDAPGPRHEMQHLSRAEGTEYGDHDLVGAEAEPGSDCRAIGWRTGPRDDIASDGNARDVATSPWQVSKNETSPAAGGHQDPGAPRGKEKKLEPLHRT